jgi:hypothetical protein
MGSTIWSGLVEPLGDMGTQSIPPIHRELLDYLALDLMNTKVEYKKLIREMVLSGTYKQSSSLNNSNFEKDPQNYYLARDLALDYLPNRFVIRL